MRKFTIFAHKTFPAIGEKEKQRFLLARNCHRFTDRPTNQPINQTVVNVKLHKYYSDDDDDDDDDDGDNNNHDDDDDHNNDDNDNDNDIVIIIVIITIIVVFCRHWIQEVLKSVDRKEAKKKVEKKYLNKKNVNCRQPTTKWGCVCSCTFALVDSFVVIVIVFLVSSCMPLSQSIIRSVTYA